MLDLKNNKKAITKFFFFFLLFQYKKLEIPCTNVMFRKWNSIWEKLYGKNRWVKVKDSKEEIDEEWFILQIFLIENLLYGGVVAFSLPRQERRFR